MSLEQLWSGWRSTYVTSVVVDRKDEVGDPADLPDDAPPPPQGSLFERILESGLPDEETFVVRRGATCAALMNIYPYTNGHLMVLPQRAVVDLDGLTDEEHAELWAMVRQATVALTSAFRCEGLNVGANLGTAGGAGVPDHLHIHVVPRWHGDTNFMTATANTRVLPVSLHESWERIRAAWPEP